MGFKPTTYTLSLYHQNSHWVKLTYKKVQKKSSFSAMCLICNLDHYSSQSDPITRSYTSLLYNNNITSECKIMYIYNPLHDTQVIHSSSVIAVYYDEIYLCKGAFTYKAGYIACSTSA